MDITYEELQERIPTISSYSADGDQIKRYSKFLKIAEKWVITEITGQSLFDKIQAETDDVAKEFCKDMICYNGYLEAMPFLDLIETGSGFAVTSNTNIAPASKDRVSTLKSSLGRMLTTSVDNFIAYLEKTITYHESWKSSPTYSILSDTFISTITEFNLFAKFDGTRLDFIAAHPIMLNAIKLKLAQYISLELCDELLDQIKTDQISASNEPIIDEVKLAYANFVVGNDAIAIDYANRLQATIIKNIQDFPAFEASQVYATYLLIQANQTTDEGILTT